MAADPLALYARTRAGLQRYLLSRGSEARARIDEASERDPRAVAQGLEACWDAAWTRRPQVLLVDDALESTGANQGRRVATRYHDLDPAAGAISTRQDVVEDLIEIVINRGGWVALARPGSLREHRGVALLSTDGA